MFAVLLTVFALSACSEDDEPDKPTPDEPTTTVEDAVLTASKTEIVANGKDEVTFTVQCGEVDVTAQSIIMHNGAKIDGHVFSTNEAGQHEFYAVYHAADDSYQVTKKLTVTATPDPEQFTDFRRRVLAIQGTGTWCGYCPRLGSGILYFCENDTHSDDVLFVAAHSADALSNNFSHTIINHLSMDRLPAMKLNLDNGITVGTGGGLDAAAIAYNIRNSVDMILRTPAKTAIKATASKPDANGDITINADIKAGVAASYRVAAWLIEDNVFSKQYDPYGYGGSEAIFDNHNNVLRASSSQNATGDLLNGKSSIEAKTIEQFSCTLNTNTAKVKNTENCRVLIVVTAYNSGIFTVDNVINVPLGKTVDYEYKK